MLGPYCHLSLLIYTHSIKLRKKRLKTAQFEERNEHKRRVLTSDRISRKETKRKFQSRI